MPSAEEQTETSTEEEKESSGEDETESSADEEKESSGEDETESSSDDESKSSSDEEAESSSEDESESSEKPTPSAIEDVGSLPGETIRDQDGRKIGEVKEIYGVGENDTPMWVTVEASTGIGRSRLVFIPIARLKQTGEEIRTPYSFQHIQESPEVEVDDELSEEDERSLRIYYAIGLADQEFVENAQSYASQVPDEDEPARKLDASDVEGPVREIDDTPPGERTREIDEAEREDEDEKDQPRKATADDVLDGDEDESGEEESKDESKEESKDEPKGESEESKEDDSESQEDDSKGESDEDDSESEEESESKEDEQE